MEQRTTHPEQLGFHLGLEAWVSSVGKIEASRWSSDAKTVRDIVYVAIGANGAALKIGQTGKTLYFRWYGILRLIGAEPDTHKFRPNEWRDRDRWRNHVLGSNFTVWFKTCQQVPLEYKDGKTRIISLRLAEEDYLDFYFRPLIGRRLDTRRQEHSC